MNDLAWAGALFVPLMTLVLGMLGPLRRAVTQWGNAHVTSAAERDAAAQRVLADVEADRHQLAVDRVNIAAHTERERARLAMETAQYETDAEAARRTLDDAAAARAKVLQARADAEAALAPEAARQALDAADGAVMANLTEAYAAYCANCPGTPWSWEQWIGEFEGLPRG